MKGACVMLPIRYVHRDFILSGEAPVATVSIGRGANFLESSPNERYYENYMSYADPANRYVSRFDCGISNKPAGYRICNRILPSILFKILLSGSLVYNGMTMQSGDAIFVEPYHPFNSVPNVEGASVLWCVWEGGIMHHVAEKLKSYQADVVYHLGAVEELHTLFSSVIYNHYLHVIDINAFVSGFTDQLLAFCPSSTTRPAHAPANPLVERAVDMIEREYQTLTVEAMASRLYVDPCHLARSFRRDLGETPKQYLTRTKLTYAEYYLTNTQHTIQAIAEMVGYANYTSFYLAFRQRYGMPPEAYRRSYSSQRGES